MLTNSLLFRRHLHITVTYRSGSDQNSLSWSEANQKIAEGSQAIGATDATVTRTKKFQMVVEKAGKGVITFKTGDKGAPQLDNFIITNNQTMLKYEELDRTISDAKAIQLNQYKDGQEKELFKTTLQHAEEVLAAAKKGETTQDEINTMITELQASIDGLEVNSMKPVHMSATLNDKISMNIYFEVSEALLKDENAYVEFKVMDGEKAITKKVLVKDLKQVKGYYEASMPLFARQMSDEVILDVYTTKEDGAVSKDASYSYSIVNYANKVLAKEDLTAEEKAIVEAMLNYGAMAQVYFDYNTANLANANITNKDYEKVTADQLASYAAQVSGEIAGIKYGTSNLRLLSETAIRHHFVVGAEIADLYKAGTIKFVQVTADGEKELTPTFYDGNKVYVEVENIFAEDLDKAYTVKVINTVTKDEITVAYSAFSYANNVLTKSNEDKLQDVVKAMVVYNQKANAYKESLVQ